jgi:hypothetical protein
MKSISGLALGLAIGTCYVGFAIPISAPTNVVWDAIGCPTGVAKVTTLVCDARYNCYSVINEDVKLPVNELTQVFPNIPPTDYIARASVEYIGGPNFSSAIQNIVGLGDAPVPTPSPTVTPEPTPTPTPTSEPQVPANCVAVQSGKDSIGNQWSILVGGGDTGGHIWLITPDGVENYFMPGGGGLPGAVATHFIFNNGIAYGFDGRDKKYYKLVARNQAVEETPVCSTTPTPIPSNEFKLLIDGITAANASINQLLGLLTPPVTVTCQITAVSSYTNGDQRLTVRCTPSGFASGQSITIIKK